MQIPPLKLPLFEVALLAPLATEKVQCNIHLKHGRISYTPGNYYTYSQFLLVVIHSGN